MSFGYCKIYQRDDPETLNHLIDFFDQQRIDIFYPGCQQVGVLDHLGDRSLLVYDEFSVMFKTEDVINMQWWFQENRYDNNQYTDLYCSYRRNINGFLIHEYSLDGFRYGNDLTHMIHVLIMLFQKLDSVRLAQFLVLDLLDFSYENDWNAFVFDNLCASSYEPDLLAFHSDRMGSVLKCFPQMEHFHKGELQYFRAQRKTFSFEIP